MPTEQDFQNVEFPDGKGYTRHGSPEFYKLLKEAAETHDKKSHDYASQDNPYGNYKFAGLVANLFSHSSDDAGFVGRIAEKLYRLANLERDGKTPKNESIEDTEKDIFVIVGLWMASRRERRLREYNSNLDKQIMKEMVKQTEKVSPDNWGPGD